MFNFPDFSHNYTTFAALMLQQPSKNWVNWLIFIILSVIWGSSFILMKEGMKSLSAYQVASIRILAAGLILLPVALRQFRNVQRKDLPLIILSGLLGTFFPAYLFCIAETKLDSSVAGILNALTPLFTFILGALFFHLSLSAYKWAGVIIGLAGLVLLVLSGSREVSFANISYSGFIIVATILYGLNVNLVNRNLRHIPSLTLAALAFSSLAVPAALALWATGYFSLPTTGGFVYSTGASAILGVFGTAVASVLFYMLMKRAGAVLASMVTYGIPCVALTWGYLAGESITAIQFLCLGLILGGVWLANRKG
jgi:drug/metabolite transporter (DMT)-like permease